MLFGYIFNIVFIGYIVIIAGYIVIIVYIIIIAVYICVIINELISLSFYGYMRLIRWY